jgi:hypothetical protein
MARTDRMKRQASALAAAKADVQRLTVEYEDELSRLEDREARRATRSTSGVSR